MNNYSRQHRLHTRQKCSCMKTDIVDNSSSSVVLYRNVCLPISLSKVKVKVLPIEATKALTGVEL